MTQRMTIDQNKKSLFVEITTTNKCNCNCAYCFEKHNACKQQTVLDYEQKTMMLLLNACRQFDKSKFEWLTISFWGGEPFLNLEFIEEYRGDKIPNGKKSITFRVKMGNNDSTMTNEQIINKANAILKILNKKYDIVLREE